MLSPRRIRPLGWITFAVFLGMALALKVVIEPKTGFMPQNLQGPYTDQDLLNFANTLAAQKLIGLYRILLGVDVVFIVLFAVWGCLLHIVLSTSPVRWLGVILTLSSAGLDLAEDRMIFTWLARAGTDFQVNLPVNISALYTLTLAKFAAFLLALLSAYVISRRFRTPGV
ncbi:MAG: hypothetical protein AAF754_12715 [Pseudomonadota bacterium]